MNVRLYTTVGCHLCEDALALLQQASQSGADLEISEIEISDEDELLERYGIRIPVVARGDGVELGWPFTLEELNTFLT